MGGSWLHFNMTAMFHDVVNCMHQGIDRTGSCMVAPGVCSNSLYQLGAVIVIKVIHKPAVSLSLGLTSNAYR